MIKLDPWTIALYRILDKITSGVRDPDRNHSLLKINKIAEWMTNESVVNPASRNFKDLTSLSVKSLYLEYLKYPNHSKQVNEQKLWNYSDAIKKNQEAADAYKLRKTGKQPFPYSELARNCVEEHLKIFFDYDIEYTVLESGMKVPYLDEGNNVTFKKVPTKKTKFSKGEQDRYYLAFYMRGELTPNVGMVSVSWKKVGNIYKPLSATLEQAENPFGKEDDMLITFTAKDQRDPIVKKNSSVNYFKFQSDDKSRHPGIIFQCVIDFPDYHRDSEIINREHPMIFGSYSAIRKAGSKLPVAGSVILVETSSERLKDEYKQIRKYVREKPLKDHNNELIANFLNVNYYLGNKILVVPELKYDNEEESVFSEWKAIAKDLTGIYLGKLYVEDVNSHLRKEVFKFDINPLGHCTVEFLSRKKKCRGIVKIDSDSFQTTLSNRDGNEFTLVLKYVEGLGRFRGIFHGYLPTSGLMSQFNSGSVVIEKQAVGDNPTQEYIESVLENSVAEGEFRWEVLKPGGDMHKDELKRYLDQVSENSNSFPDGGILRSLLLEQSPIFNNRELNGLGLPEHMKYITFRIPERKKFEPGIFGTMFRFEKCDLRFFNKYKDVELTSPNNNFIGKVYFNGNVILIILNPVDEAGKIIYTDNFFTIQLDAHKIVGNNINNVDTLFGTSTWKSTEYIESKMIVLRKAEEDDNEVGIYPMGAHGYPPSKDEINELNVQDRKYKGAFSYLCGRLNRHIHISSGNGKKDFFRPRDTSSREPFLHAAMYLISQLDEVNHKDLFPKIRNYLTESLMHQYASTYYAGEELNESLIDSVNNRNVEVIERLNAIVTEQSDLRDMFMRIPVKQAAVRNLMSQLWPFLNG